MDPVMLKGRLEFFVQPCAAKGGLERFRKNNRDSYLAAAQLRLQFSRKSESRFADRNGKTGIGTLTHDALARSKVLDSDAELRRRAGAEQMMCVLVKAGNLFGREAPSEGDY